MPSLNVFDSSAFSMMALTNAIDKAPYQPSILGELGIFEDKPVRTTVVSVEDRQGKLSLLNTAARGAKTNARSQPSRTLRNFSVPHYPQIQTVLADDIQDIRAFGDETNLEALGNVIIAQLEGMRANHEISFEWQRAGAVMGSIKDGDMTTELYNLFTEFGTTRQAVDFVLGTATTDIKAKCSAVIRNVSDALGAEMYEGVVGLCDDTFFDSLTSHAKVETAYERWVGSDGSPGTFLRTTQISPAHPISSMRGFPFGDITFINYRGSAGGTNFLTANECQFFPIGVRGLFQKVMAPANFAETVNTLGRSIYVKQKRMDYDEGVELFSQSNSLFLCTRPRCLVRGHTSN